MLSEEWTIPGLLQLSGGYWSACALHAAVKLDMFSALDGVARTAGELAIMRSVDQRATAMLLDALAALKLLEKNGDTYVATPFAVATLSKASSGYMGHIIMHHHHLMQGWSQLHEAVTSGEPVRTSVSHGNDAAVRESFLMGMFNLASILAPHLARSINFTDCRRLLDLGGGPGTYAIYFCQANPELSATVFDLPTTREFAEKTVARFDLVSRVSFTAGDYHNDPIPHGFDVAWLSHILHSDSPAACVALLKKAVTALNPGGRLLIQEFILNDAKDAPLFPALFSLNMLLGTMAGQAYSGIELKSMMEAAGLSDVTRLDIELPNGAGVMSGRKQ